MNLFPLRARVRIALSACTLLGSTLLASVPGAAGGGGLQAYVAAERARPVAPALPRSAFLQRGAIVAIRLSRDGRHAAWLRDRGEQREVWLQNTAGGPPRRLLGNTPADALDWSRDGGWLLLRSPRDLQALAVARQAGSGRIATLGGATAVAMLDTDPSQPAAVLLIEREGPAAAPRGWRLLRVDMRGRRTVLWQDRQRIVDAAIDARGEVAWLQRVEGGALVVHRVARGAAHPVLHCVPSRRCALRGLAPDGGVWMRTDLQGDLSRLARLQVDGRIVEVHADPQRTADVDAIIEDPVGRQPRLVAYRSTTSQLYALAPDDGAHLDALRAALPGRDLDLQPGVGSGARWLVETASPQAPLRRWQVYDPATRTLSPLLDDMPLDRRSGAPAAALDEALLARPVSVAWTASDGRRAHGFLWLPPGRDAARLPLVVVPHGGPWNHWKPEYRALSQLLANRGYAVFEPNFRGSTGHGRDYVLAARGDFGHGRVQADIVEGTRWLLDQGIGDRERVGIVGASFGGYSALLGATFDPDLFKVAVAMVPPPDFGWVLRWVLRNPEALEIGGVVPMEDWLLGQGIDVADRATMARLHAQSPLANVDRLRRPVLLVAGGEDRRVGLAGVIEYAARLKLAGKDVALLVDEQAGHDGGSPTAREARAYLMEMILQRELGGVAPAAPDPELRGYLRRNLRLPGTLAP
ncbi:Dipeptidyl aminopeptidase/acylaminoacyl peptidase [Pseudoxanthomonas sp. CF385]|uniref:S9 family peptidase n=1 Tax=Pseudoxanthomonas sp. CF385 TaxID=1881042 RepID=UPI00088391F3|nr:prolyl oligopeptidase family serine peptidase [Pseudoxanthomonas sp. CF385]SDQ41905.1 Dipeptidyl aminopeptidase/acylaminoacyl peptidase [Pseudoxanthomonas sp. CF385]